MNLLAEKTLNNYLMYPTLLAILTVDVLGNMWRCDCEKKFARTTFKKHETYRVIFFQVVNWKSSKGFLLSVNSIKKENCIKTRGLT